MANVVPCPCNSYGYIDKNIPVLDNVIGLILSLSPRHTDFNSPRLDEVLVFVYIFRSYIQKQFVNRINNHNQMVAGGGELTESPKSTCRGRYVDRRVGLAYQTEENYNSGRRGGFSLGRIRWICRLTVYTRPSLSNARDKSAPAAGQDQLIGRVE